MIDEYTIKQILLYLVRSFDGNGHPNLDLINLNIKQSVAMHEAYKVPHLIDGLPRGLESYRDAGSQKRSCTVIRGHSTLPGNSYHMSNICTASPPTVCLSKKFKRCRAETPTASWGMLYHRHMDYWLNYINPSAQFGSTGRSEHCASLHAGMVLRGSQDYTLEKAITAHGVDIHLQSRIQN
ncbi:hypothetical protein BDD12DRAFT_383758 [Trichophaea hybrida]|nr:hypothetical protein BDD12DRAFT_383758 [Trichophaea hybrida]